MSNDAKKKKKKHAGRQEQRGSAWLAHGLASVPCERWRRRQGGGQLRGGACVLEAPRSSQAAPAAGGRAVQSQARSSGGQSRARTPRLTASSAFRTARGRGRDPGVSGHHAPYTCPGPVAWVTRRAPQPRPCPARLSLTLPDLLCTKTRVTLLWIGLVGSLSLSVSSWLGDTAPEVRR